MQRLRWGILGVIAPSLVLVGLTVGCSGGDKDKDKDKDKAAANDKKDDSGNKGVEMKPVEAKSRGTLKGRVTVVGAPPDLAKASADLKALMEKHKDKDLCLAGDSAQQDWRIGDKDGLAEVFVWVQAPANHYFKLDKSDLEGAPKTVTLDQPNCAFIPHVAGFFPAYYDGESKAEKSTGQKVVIKNSAPVTHNTKFAGGNKNRGDNLTIPGGKEEAVKKAFVPDEKEITFQCDLHPWMRGYGRAFSHPFFAITDKDGNFEIKNVPAGTELQIITWHPAGGYGDGGKDGVKMMIKDGDNSKDLQIKAK